MSASPAADRQWEYRQIYITPYQECGGQVNWDDATPQVVEDLLETVAQLDRATGQRWRLVSVKAEQDDAGRCRLKACVKRPASAADPQPGESYPATIPLPQAVSGLTASIHDESTDPGIEKAA